MDICPICNCRIDMCQCQYENSDHPNRGKRREVALDYPYMLSQEERENIIKELFDEYTPEYNITKIANEEDMTKNEAIEAACNAVKSLTTLIWSRTQ